MRQGRIRRVFRLREVRKDVESHGRREGRGAEGKRDEGVEGTSRGLRLEHRGGEPALRPATPYEVAIRILHTRFGDVGGGHGKDRGPDRPVFDLARFQTDAVARAEMILATRRGVVIADGVGLGKTFIALALAERALRRGERVAVSSPAALHATWVPPLRRLARELDVRTTFGLGADDPVGSETGPAVAWFSHTRLSRGTHRPERIAPVGLVVVDEAHAFRNEATRRYRALASLCVGAHVVLLTATPVNNSPMDLYALLRLFASDGAFRDVGVPDLREAFRAAALPRAAQTDDDGVPPTLEPVLRAVVIRRTRAFLRSQYGGIEVPAGAGSKGRRRGPVVLRFPRRAPPVPVRYSSLELFGRRDSALAMLEELTFAPFRWPDYASGTHRARGGEPELLRLTLLKRLESSVDALRTSVRRQLRFHHAFLDALDHRRLLAPADFRTLFSGADDGDAVQLVLDDVALRPLPADLDVSGLADATRRDEERLWRLHRLLAAIEPSADPKLDRLRAVLSDDVRDGKVVIFTEFRATARGLWRALHRDRAVALVDGNGARLGDRRCGRRAAIVRFAPHANGAREPHRRERVDTLIATDVLAEGLDLHDADRVVSYDLPWNPVRLIQRVGRIDRLGSEHATVRSYHFLPADGLERFLRLVARLRWKLGAIGRTVGGDAVLAASAAPARSFNALVDRLAAGDPDALDAVDRRATRPFEIEDRLFAAYRSATAGPADPEPENAPVPVAVLHVPGDEAPRTLVAVRSARHMAVWTHHRDGRTTRGDVDAAEWILCALDAAPSTVTSAELRHARRAIDAARGEAARVAALCRAGEPVRARSTVARAARALFSALVDLPGGPEPALCRRVDRLLEWLAAGHDAGTEQALRAALDAHQDGAGGKHHAASLVERLEDVRGRGEGMERLRIGPVDGTPGRISASIPGETPAETPGKAPGCARAETSACRRSATDADPVAIGVIVLRPVAGDDPHPDGPQTG